ncbi:MAG: metalloregulator ArsR/SmtB family transcription factor [Candidatus Sericytochromatia bacterium]|nr:metalloregulator ArsR/SmtB family transcription factor [Candidatus Sericytochromatia bacterium]
MPARRFVAKEVSTLLGVLAHPARLLIIEELGLQECDVKGLAEILQLPSSGVSQHLALLRAHRLVAERRDGRRVLYRLQRPELASWLTDGLEFLAESDEDHGVRRQLVDAARAHWQGVATDG